MRKIIRVSCDTSSGRAILFSRIARFSLIFKLVCFSSQYRAMTTMEILISEVVWNKKYHRYKDRIAVDKEWDEISISTGLAKDDAKKKWRNLRDQFTKELKKISKPRSGDPKEFVASYSRKWQYFANMLFLKDTLIPRNTEGNISLNVLEASESTTAINDDDEVEKEVIDHEPNPNNDALQSDVNIGHTNANPGQPGFRNSSTDFFICDYISFQTKEKSKAYRTRAKVFGHRK
ncbi:uncharacterized protein LOC126734324 [Anthonomus grandis grandis]|uniref:uncharacterized protein LOC126734324 n=1 Tax=Anthonomus grandis grandis TaxID=2921223 RepID=UPI0021663FBD|nr:uncharacterized protein LOC126734324 [Anthonomus grandis grandis]